MDCWTFWGRRGGKVVMRVRTQDYCLCLDISFTHGVWMCIQVGSRVVGKVCQGCITETVRYRKLILGWDISWECRCTTSWCDLDFTLDLAVMTLTYKILSMLFLGNSKV